MTDAQAKQPSTAQEIRLRDTGELVGYAQSAPDDAPERERDAEIVILADRRKDA